MGNVSLGKVCAFRVVLSGPLSAERADRTTRHLTPKGG
ncbi:hypothetical protein NSU_0065 [Novosphingobium pentaromativorans US6-1]|uniref:Uncharacterized protein n=1 Tax=Novosphingobium pentaromativorans US6-1 TaxID=1088721 RepID=G6E6U4_9SPHN|nr:hypothetical protein NSU_0065 [Novosphingobium pentaromativorans US6-1]